MAKKFFDIIPPTPSNISREESREPASEKEIFSVLPVSLEKGKEKKRGIGKKLVTAVSLFLLFVFLFFHFVLSKAEIEIWPETENLNLEEKITVDVKSNKSDFRSRAIPGKILGDERMISQQFPASGKSSKEEYAKGTIRVYNNYHLAQKLIVNTRFQPALEKVLYFRLIKTVVVPAKSELDVEVRADRPGEEYNIKPSTFSVPGLAGLPQYYSVYGKSFSPMSGGFKGEVKQISKEDLEGAQKILQEKLEKESKDYLRNKISEEFILLDKGIIQEIVTASSSPQEGSESESFNFNLKTKAKTIVFRKTDLENLAKEFIDLKTQKTDKKIQPESLNLNYSLNSIDIEGGKIFLELKISAKIYSDVDEFSLKKNVSGKSLEETQLHLKNQSQITNSKIKIFPFWLKKIPEDIDKIKIELNFND